MINYFFILIIIISISYGLYTGNINNINESLLKLPLESFSIFINMSIIIIFFQGILEIAYKTNLINFISRFTNILLRPIFKNINDHKVMNLISLNLICNFLGMGGAATSAGFDVCEELTKSNKKNYLFSFLLLNSSGFTLIPTTLIAIREEYMSNNSSLIIFPTFIVSFISFISAYMISIFITRNED